MAVGETLPQSGTPQSCIDQVTPLCAGSSFTVATMFGSLPPNRTVVLGALTDTKMALTVTVIDAFAAGSSTDVAVTVIGKS